MALTKRQIQKYRTNTSDGESGKTKAQLFSDKYKKLEDEKKEKETADIAEREAYAKELTKKVEEQKEKERTAKIVDELESKTVPFNAQFGANTNTVELTTPSEQQVAQQQAAIGSYNNRMMNPQSQVAKKDSLTAALSNIPVNIQKNSTNTLKSLEDAETDVAQAMQNQYAVDQFNKTGELPGLPETDLTKITTEKKEETVLPGVTRPYTQTEQQVEQLQATISELNEKKNDVLYRKSQARGTAHQELANEANEIQKEIDTLQKELDSIVSPESNDTTAEENDLPLWQKVANTATYTAGRFGVGAGSTVENWASALQNTLGDLATQGEYSNDQNKLYTYLSEHPEMRRQLYVSGAGQSYAQQKVADAAGVSLDTVKNYVRTSGTEDLREGLEDIEGVSDLWRNSAGNWAESIGQQLPGMMLGAGGVSEGASAATKALSENATLGSIGASVYGQTLEQLGRERGFDTANYVNATLQGAIEVGTEKMGFTGLESLTNPVAATGNTKKSVGRAILSYLANGAEEGLEEVINAPLSEIADRITGISDNQNIVGAGGIFDASEMVEGGASGFVVGMIMGGVGSIAGIVNTVKESNDIKQAVEDLRTLQNEYPPAYRAEIPTDLNSITTETMDNILAEQMRLFEQLEEDVIDGNVKYGDTPESEQVVTNENTDPGQDPAVVNKDTDNTVADTNNTVNDTNGTVSDTDNTISDTNNTTNNTENIETETVEDTVVDEDSDYDYAEYEISKYADEDSDMAKALRTVNVNPVSARDTLLEAYNNDAKSAVDALYEEGRRITSEGGDFVQERLAQVEKLRDSVLANSSKLSEEGTQRLTKAFRQYGIKNVVVDSKLVTDAGDTLTNAMYDPATKTIHVSPLLGTDAAMAAYATHELVHHTATADSNIVSDIIAAKDSLVNAGVMDAEMFNLDRYISAYSDVIQTYGKSAEGKAAVQKYIDSGVDAETAKYRVVEDYINEEIAGDFMAELANEPDIAKKLTADNRNFIQKIYDAIVDFINKLRGKEDVQKYQHLADTLRSILSEKTGETVKTKKVDGVKNSGIANKVSETQETNAERQKEQPTDKPEVAETESKNKTDTSEEQKAKTESKTNGKEDTDTKSSGTFAERIAGWEDTPEGTKIPINGIREDGAIGALGISVDDITFDTDSVAKWEQRQAYSKYSKKLYESVIDQRVIDHIPDVLNSPMVITDGIGAGSIVVYGDVALNGNKKKTVEIVIRKDGDGYAVTGVDVFKSKTITELGLTDVLYLNPNESATVAWFKEHDLKLPFGGEEFGVISENALYLNLDESATTAWFKEHNLEKPAVQNIESIGTQKRFSLSQPVEKTENLVAVHNITEENLAVALSEGGFPMPSIAVVNSADGHNEFGEISVVFGRDTIDPELDKSNKVYSGDAWTPTYPTVEYKASKDLKKRVKDVYDKVSRPDSIIINLYSDPDYVLNTYGGADGLAEHLKEDTSAMGNYLESIGEEVQPITVETTEKMTDVDVKQGGYFLDQLGGGFVEAVNAEAGVVPKTKLKNYAKANEETLRDVYKNYLVDVKGYTETVLPGTMYNLKLVDIVNAIGNAYNVAKGNVEKTTTKVDYDATRAAVKEKADQFGYSRWVDELVDGAVEKKGIYNGKDPYTQSGNRRSFDTLHMEYTLENVVKAMMQKGGKAATSNDPYTGIFPASAKEFKNIGEVKKAGETQLQRIDESEYNEIRKKYTDRFVDIAYRIGASQSTMETLIDAVASRKTMQGIDSYLEKNLGEYDVENYTPEIAEEFHDLIKDIQSMPASYFEAKPERVVGIDEIKAFIVPDYTKSGVIEKLNETGKTVLTYTYGDSQSRIDALNSLDGVRFSRDVLSQAEKDNIRLREQKEYYKQQLAIKGISDVAVSVSPSARHKISSDVASKLPGVSTGSVLEVLDSVYKVLDRPKKSGETINSRIEEAMSVAYEGSKELVENAVEKRTNPLYESMADLKRTLRETRLYNSVSESEFGGAEDYKEWKKGVRNLIKLTNDESALPIDSFYQELCETNPELFPADITNPADQLKHIGEVAESLKGLSKTEEVSSFEGLEEQVATEMANELVMGYFTNAKITESAKRANKANADKQKTVEKITNKKDAEIKKLKEENKQLHKTAERALGAAFERQQAARNEKILENLTGELYKRVDKLNAQVDKITQKAVKKDNRLALATERKKFETTLKKLNEEVTRPTKKSSVPETLRSAVAEMLLNFKDTETKTKNPVNEETLTKIMNSVEDNRIDLGGKDGDNNNSDSKNSIQDNFRATLQEKVNVLKAAWELVEEKQAEIDRKLSLLDDIPQTKAEVENADGYVTPLTKTEVNSDISASKTELDQLKTDYYHTANDILAMVNKYINQQNKIFIDGKWQDVDVYADSVIGDLTGKRRYKDSINNDSANTSAGAIFRDKVRGFGRSMAYESVNASLFFHAMGETGDAFERRLREAGYKTKKLKSTYENRMLEVTGGTYDTTKASGVGNRRVTLNIGDSTVDASKAQLMSLYLLWKRKDARRHLQSQGACFLDKSGNEFTSRTFVIDEDIMREVRSKLSEKDIEVANAIGQFLSNECSKAGNDATLEVYGFAAFLEDNYFPMDVATGAKLKDAPVWGVSNVSTTLEDVGFMKHVDPRSTCALRIGNVFDVAEAHVAKMAAFSGYAPVLSDMQKVFRRTDVREAMLRGMGKEGVQYLNDFLKKANQNELKAAGKSNTYALFGYLGNMAKRNAVMFNASTTVKQLTSIYRAGTEIEWKYLDRAFTLPFRRQDANTEYSRAFHRMTENSGVARMKIEGNSDTGFGKEMRQSWDKSYVNSNGIVRSTLNSNDVTRGVVRGYDKFTDLGMKAAAKADETTLVRIWKASELKVNDLYSNLTAEQKMEKTVEIFENVVGRSQVVDSLLDAAPFKDSLGGLGSVFGVFMNEPMKTFGNLCVAVERFKDGKPGSGKHLANVIGSILVSNVIVEPLISAMFSGWRDEEDDSEQALRKLLKNYVGIDLTDGSEGTEPIDVLSSNVVQGIAGIIPVFGEVYEIFTNTMQGYSSGTDMGVGLAEDVIESTAALLNPELNSKTKIKKISDFVSVTAQLCGISYNRFAKGVGSAIRNTMSATDNYLARWEFNKIWYRLENTSARSNKYFYDIMADAYKAGDTEAYAIMRKELSEVINDSGSVGVSASTITNAIEKRGGKIEVGSDLWYIDLQAGFDLDSFNTSMKVEKMITAVYSATNEDSILPSSISNSFTVNKKTVKVEDPIEYQAFAEEAGDFSYMILTNMESSDAYKKLDDQQKVYAIKQAYEYARKRARKNYSSAYDFNNKTYTELYEDGATPATVAKEILSKAEDKDYSEDE